MMTLSLALGLALGQAPPPIVAKLKNYSVTPGFYDPPHEQQMKSLLQGEQAEPQAGGLYLLTGVKLQTFRVDGQPELVVETPQCVYDSSRRSVSSSEPIKARTADGKFLIEGQGFLWQQTNSSLLISNRVHTLVQPELLASPAADTEPATVSPELKAVDIFSDQFEYATEPGLGVYRGNVRATGTNLAVTCGLLTFRLPMRERQLETITAEQNVVADYEGLHATGQRALYTVATGRLDVSGHPAWTHGQRQGRSEELVIDRTNKIYRALGAAYLKLPAERTGTAGFLPALPAAATTNAPGTTNQFVEITCDHYEVRTNLAVFEDQVHVRELADEQLRGQMRCGRMTAAFTGTNELQTLLAENAVTIEQEEQQFSAGRAFYTATNGLLELTRDPRWRAVRREGRGDLILVNAPEQTMTVEGQAFMRLPAEEMGERAAVPAPAAATEGPKPPEEQFAQITSDRYKITRQQVFFDGNVRVVHPQINLTCGQMTGRLPAAGEKSQNLEASQSVVFVLTSEQGEQVHGRGERVLYNYSVIEGITNDTVRLTGNPLVETTNGTFSAPVIMFDRAQNKLFAPAKYRIRGSGTNEFTNRFEWPIK